MRRLTWILVVAVAVLCAAAPAALAKTITVTSKQDSGPGTIRQALLDAAPGDTIFVPPGTYQVTSASLPVTKNVTLKGAYTRTTVLQADGNNRVIDVAGSLTNVTIEGVTITGGNDTPGAGIRALSPLTLIAVEIFGNRAGGTGDIQTGTPATGNGGGLYATGATTIKLSTFHDNRALDGGGIYFESGSGAQSIENSTFIQNRADGDGGAIREAASPPSPANTTVTAANVTAQSNFTEPGGTGHGGFVFIGANDVAQYRNSIIFDNGAGAQANGPNCWPEPTSTATSLGGNFWGGVDIPDRCGFGMSDTHGEPNAGPLGNWGGPTETLKIGFTSSAADLDPADANCPAIDQRGVTRPQNGDCDAGAFEFSYPTATIGPARDVTSTSATIPGTVNTQGLPGRVSLVERDNGGFPHKDVGPSRSTRPVALTVTGLHPSTTYHVQLVVNTVDNEKRTAFMAFTTKPKPTPTPPPPVRCHVPKLKGLTLAKAKAKLKRAHCRLGKVRHAHKGRARRHPIVIHQTIKPGRVRPRGTKVGVTLSRKKH